MIDTSKVVRISLGLFFTIFGLNGLMMIVSGAGFIPMPPPSKEFGELMGHFFGAIYLMPLVKTIQLSAGIMLLSNKFINLSLILLAPILINILGAHMAVADFAGLPFGIIATLAWIYLFKKRFSAFKPLFSI